MGPATARIREPRHARTPGAVENIDIARIFDEIADLLEIQGNNQFRIRAYRTAARTIETLPVPAATLAEAGTLDDLPGVGSDLAGKITEEKMLQGVAALRGHEGRWRLADADAYIYPLMAYLKECDAVERLDVAGSYRRRKDTVGDVDILAVSSTPRAVVKRFVDYPRVTAAVRAATIERLAATTGVGHVAATQIAEFFARPRSRRVVEGLLRHGLVIARVRGPRHGPLTGQVVVFTGSLDSMTRARAAELVIRAGGRAADRVSRATRLVVAGVDPGSKVARARALGVPVVSEQEFLRRVTPQ